MALSTYAELQAAIASHWADRDDLTAAIPDHIRLAEAEFNRTLFVPEREEVATSSISSETHALPADFHRIIAVTIDDALGKVPLDQVTVVELRTLFSSGETGRPSCFAIQGGNELLFGPVPDATYPVRMNYYRAIPALSEETGSNWLLAGHPDIYLYGAMLQSELALVNDARAPLWQAKLDRAIEQLLSAGRKKAWGGARLRSDLPSVRPVFNINTGI